MFRVKRTCLKGKERRKDGRKEGREEGREGGRERGRKEGRKERNVLFKSVIVVCLRQSKGRKEMFYLMMHSTHFIYGYMVSDIW